MDNKKKLTVVLAVLAVVCVFAVLVFSGVLGGNPIGGEEPTTDAENSFSSDSYKALIKTSASTDLPYLETDIENVFATVSKTGEVKFYEFADNTFAEIQKTGSYDVTVKMSEQNVSATVSYYEKDGVISGYGLYTGKTDGFDLYPYAFFRLANYGENYSEAYSTSCLLLVDTTADDFYSNDKIYEEPFIFKYSDSSASRMLSEASRTVGIDGAKRSDYSLITDAVIDGSEDHQLFFSGRQYAESDETVDLFRSGGSGNNTDNIRLAKNVLGYWAKYVDGDIMYISTDASGNVIVASLDDDSDEVTVVKTFEGVTGNDILVSGDYIYIISTNTVYSILEDKEVKLAYKNAESFKADMFEVLGDKFIVRGYIDSRYPAFACASLDGNVTLSMENAFFRFVVNPVAVGDSIMLTCEENGKFTYYIF